MVRHPSVPFVSTDPPPFIGCMYRCFGGGTNLALKCIGSQCGEKHFPVLFRAVLASPSRAQGPETNGVDLNLQDRTEKSETKLVAFTVNPTKRAKLCNCHLSL
jgi:hypothetical protein